MTGLYLSAILLVLTSPLAVCVRDDGPVRDDCEDKFLMLSEHHSSCLEDSPHGQRVLLSQATKDSIVRKHNMLRARVSPPAADMQKMVWDDKLAATAAKWAMRCSTSSHDKNDARREPDYPQTPIGQNAGGGHTDFDVLMSRWFNETRFYTYGGRYIAKAGHYFQMVFHESVRIGCAESVCSNLRIRRNRFCNYALRLDASRQPYTNGTWCSKCPEHCDTDTNKLCDCQGKICYNGGHVNVSNCQCVCKEGFKGDMCEERDCPNQDYLRRCSFRRKADCGWKFNAENCPILCGLCPEPCPGTVCGKKGDMDYETCTCVCRAQWQGESCDMCPLTDDGDCGSWDPAIFCKYSHNFRARCPYYCGDCPKAPDLTCQVCQNFGQMVNETTCTCKCEGLFTGQYCEKCPSVEAEGKSGLCASQPTTNCKRYPFYAKWMHIWCPIRCEVCLANGTLAG